MDSNRKDQVIAEAALCLLINPYGAIKDTIWLTEGRGVNITLYEHLVCELGIEMTGDIELDKATLAALAKAKGGAA